MKSTTTVLVGRPVDMRPRFGGCTESADVSGCDDRRYAIIELPPMQEVLSSSLIENPSPDAVVNVEGRFFLKHKGASGLVAFLFRKCPLVEEIRSTSSYRKVRGSRLDLIEFDVLTSEQLAQSVNIQDDLVHFPWEIAPDVVLRSGEAGKSSHTFHEFCEPIRSRTSGRVAGFKFNRYESGVIGMALPEDGEYKISFFFKGIPVRELCYSRGECSLRMFVGFKGMFIPRDGEAGDRCTCCSFSGKLGFFLASGDLNESLGELSIE
jgi:hypothetical protein